MELGFTTMNTPEDVGIRASSPARSRTRGFTSLWIGEHSHIPAVAHARPTRPAASCPAPYRRMMDPFLSLLLAAEATTACGSARAWPSPSSTTCSRWPSRWQRSIGSPAAGSTSAWGSAGTSRSSPTTDPTSRGRARYRALEECITALKALWRDEEAEHHGRWFDFDAAWCRAEALQGRTRRSPGAWPVGSAPPTPSRGVTQWMPMDLALGDVAKRVERFRQAVAEAGRAPMPIVLMTWGDPTPRAPRWATATSASTASCSAPDGQGWDDPTRTLPFLDRYAELVPELAG